MQVSETNELTLHGKPVTTSVLVGSSEGKEKQKTTLDPWSELSTRSQFMYGVPGSRVPGSRNLRLRRYHEPLRHPGRPGLSLAGVRLRGTRPRRLGFPVLRWISVYRHAVVITPVARWVGSLVGRSLLTVSLLASGYSLPHLCARSASTSVVSRPARRSLALWPACSLHRQSDTCVSKAPTASLPPPPLR